MPCTLELQPAVLSPEDARDRTRLGATPVGDGTSFVVVAPHASAVDLCLLQTDGAGAVGLEQAQVDGGGVRGDDDEARAVPHGGSPQARTVAGVLGAEDRGLQLERARHEGHCPGWARPVPTPTVRVRHTPPVR